MATRTFRYRIYPNREQAVHIMQFCGCARKVYNLLLAWWKDAYAKSKRDNTPMERTPNYSYFKAMPEYAYLKQCDAVALANAKLNFDKAMEEYFKSKQGKRKGKKVGFPQFKRKGISRDAYTTFNNNGTIRLSDDGKHIRLPKLGEVRIVLHRPCYGTIKSVNVSRSKAGNYFVAITVETGEKDKPLFNRAARCGNPSVVGLDMSFKDFVVSSDPSDVTKSKYVRQYRKNERKLARLMRKVSRRQMQGTGEYIVNRNGREVEIKERSHNREKARLAYAKYAEKVANRRREFVIQQALYYVRKYDVVVLEGIDMQAMSRMWHHGKSAMDLGFGEFRHWLEWEAAKYDCYVYYVDKWFPSSKLCNECGHKYAELTLKEREWTCPNCGHHHDRDLNAAKNLRDEFLRKYNTVGATGIHACGDRASTLREICARALSMNQETNEEVAAASTEAHDFSRG